MVYSKPELLVLAAARVAIQGAHNNDSPDKINETVDTLMLTSPAAYEADE